MLRQECYAIDDPVIIEGEREDRFGWDYKLDKGM